jgi:hypothetical protein
MPSSVKAPVPKLKLAEDAQLIPEFASFDTLVVSPVGAVEFVHVAVPILLILRAMLD